MWKLYTIVHCSYCMYLLHLMFCVCICIYRIRNIYMYRHVSISQISLIACSWASRYVDISLLAYLRSRVTRRRSGLGGNWASEDDFPRVLYRDCWVACYIYLDCLIWDLFVPGAIKDYSKICWIWVLPKSCWIYSIARSQKKCRHSLVVSWTVKGGRVGWLIQSWFGIFSPSSTSGKWRFLHGSDGSFKVPSSWLVQSTRRGCIMMHNAWSRPWVFQPRFQKITFTVPSGGCRCTRIFGASTQPARG